MVIASATGVPRRIYEGIAGCLAEAGLAVLTFDYRGIGGSRQGRSLRERGRPDAGLGAAGPRGRAAWMRRAYAGAPLLVLGHSAGGQLIGLAPSARHLAGAALVGSQLGWAGHWPWPARAVMWSMWHGLIPVLTSAVGLPADAGPAGRARTSRPVWHASGPRWGRRRHYLFDALGAAVRETYAALRFPVRALHIADDLYAPRSGVEALVSFYGGAARGPHHHPRRGRKLPRIGHFGWVRPRFEAAIWAPIRDWFLQRLVPSPLRRVG